MIVYQFTNGTLSIYPYQNTPYEVQMPCFPGEWVGAYHYSYSTGTFNEATYSLRELFQ